MDYSKILTEYIAEARKILENLNLHVKSEKAYKECAELTQKMTKSLENCNHEMFYPTVYNACATIKTAPEGCPVSQLKEALSDAIDEMEIMSEYIC